MSRDLAESLRRFADEDPDTFYDEALMPLVRRSLTHTAEFFAAESEKKIYFMPNCTAAMKSVLESLIVSPNNYRSFAYLAPIYGATTKLLKEYMPGYLAGILSSESSEAVESTYSV